MRVLVLAKVLIGDDAAFMRMMLRDIITDLGYEVVGEARNGLEAVELYKKLQPDVVTLDITMPEKDGLTTLKEIMAINPEARCIMCSAMGQQSMVMQAVKSGAKDFSIKPFMPARIIEALDKLS